MPNVVNYFTIRIYFENKVWYFDETFFWLHRGHRGFHRGPQSIELKGRINKGKRILKLKCSLVIKVSPPFEGGVAAIKLWFVFVRLICGRGG